MAVRVVGYVVDYSTTCLWDMFMACSGSPPLSYTGLVVLDRGRSESISGGDTRGDTVCICLVKPVVCFLFLSYAVCDHDALYTDSIYNVVYVCSLFWSCLALAMI